MIDFPKEFSKRILDHGLGDLLEGLNGDVPVSIRFNRFKNSKLDFDLRPVSWCRDGFYLGERPKFTLDPLLHGGVYYVQEASSMIVGEIARKYNPKMVLDLCAAPGGKTTHLSCSVGSDGCVVANEVIRGRATVLSENVQKWGGGNVIVTSSDARNFGPLNGLFDLIVVDAPCSGEGMFRKDVNSRDQWSVENVVLCAARGRRIVSDAWNALQDGGILIYSTCTFNRAENQDNVQWICENLGATVEQIDMPSGVVVDQWGANFYPGRIEGEGFFVAVLRKNCAVEMLSCRSCKPLAKLSKIDSIAVSRWVNGPLSYRVVGDTIYGYNKSLDSVIDLILPLGVVYSGVEMGSMIRGELKPAHSLALYYDLKCDNVSDLDRDESLQFLAKQILDASMYKDSLSLVNYNGVGIGWAKSVAKGSGKRINNLYPQGWRILNLQ